MLEISGLELIYSMRLDGRKVIQSEKLATSICMQSLLKPVFCPFLRGIIKNAKHTHILTDILKLKQYAHVSTSIDTKGFFLLIFS